MRYIADCSESISMKRSITKNTSTFIDLIIYHSRLSLARSPKKFQSCYSLSLALARVIYIYQPVIAFFNIIPNLISLSLSSLFTEERKRGRKVYYWNSSECAQLLARLAHIRR